jgi:hypothetical protein
MEDASMSIQTHLKRFPNARTSTISYLVQRDKITQQLRNEVAAEARRKLFAKLFGWWKR